ncbi:type IV secretion system protein [Brucella sp. 22210]|uniref:type IV secretion system protein n=1 Tax=Brucella sp. 22210 TaxID=3453892 RepID=UPI003F877B63
MDSFVTGFVSSADSLIKGVSASGFGAVFQAINGTAAAAATLSIVALILNQFLQIHAISLGRFLGHLVKLTAIVIIGFKWNNFGQVTEAVQGGMDSIAAKLLTMTAPSSANTVAGAIDAMINTLALKGNEVGQRASWFAGAIMSNLITWQLSLLGCLGCLIIIYSKVMFSVFVCIAPMFIACYIFDTTKDYFFRWIQGAITYALYPVITAGLLGMIYNVIYSYLSKSVNQPIETIAGFIPFIATASILILAIFFIPSIVNGLSGMVQSIKPNEIISQARTLYNVISRPAPGTTNAPPPKQASAQAPRSFPDSPAKMQARYDRIHGK